MDPLDPFGIGWQRRLLQPGIHRILDASAEVEKLIDTGVGFGLGVGQALWPTRVSTPLTGHTVPLTPAEALKQALHSMADQFLDRTVALAAGGGQVTMVPRTLDTEVDSLGLARGQFARIALTAEDLYWQVGDRRYRVEHIAVDFDDIRVRTVYAPTLVFGSITVAVTVAERQLREIVSNHQPDLSVSIGGDGVLRARWARAQRLGHIVVEPTVDRAGDLVFTPAALHAGRFSVDLRRRLSARTVPVRALPWGFRLTGVDTGPGVAILYARSEQMHRPISTVPIGELPGLIRAAVRIK